MQKSAKEIQYFFYSQAFADGFRATFAILLPALIGSYFHHFDIGLTISLGAMCVSLTDAPGPITHKKNGMLICTALLFGVAVLTSFARLNIFAMGVEIAFVTFFFSMFTVYGTRATSVGNSAIVIMILTMDKNIPVNEIFLHALFIAAGGLFYTILSLLLYFFRPYRIAQRALGDCLREMAAYMHIKATFYDAKADLALSYQKLVAQQIVVNEKQDAVREVFFKTRQIVQESSREGQRLIFTFTETVDLFEDITATYYDYASLRDKFHNTNALYIIHQSLIKIVAELNTIGVAIQSGSTFRKSFDYDEEIKHVKVQIDSISQIEPANKLVLKKILVNIRKMLTGINNITQYFGTAAPVKKSSLDYSHFVTHQSLSPGVFGDNLSLQSSVFRHALRVCLACCVGFTIAKLLSLGHHSYWILLTVAFILKPAFSLTRQRNIERIIGTIAGGVIGILFLVLIPDKTILFILMVLCMIITYSFMRIYYLVMVISMTPYILILFSFLGAGFKDVAGERVVDTLIGGILAFLASHLLFPRWESDQLKNLMRSLVNANADYLQKAIEALSGNTLSILDYKLARKNVYLNSANLSAAFQRMLSEPKSKQQRSKTQLQQFIVLNHILFFNVATLMTTLLAKEREAHSAELVQLAKRAWLKLEESSKQLDSDEMLMKSVVHELPKTTVPVTNDVFLMKEQLHFIYTVSNDIARITKSASS